MHKILKNKNGILQIVFSYFVLWIPDIFKIITKELNKDVFFICVILAVLIMVDGKMKYNTKPIKVNFWIMIFILIMMIGFHIL